MSVIMRLRDMKAKTQTESQISKFIIEHPDEVLTLNSTELAERCYTSPSSIVRLSKRIGLSGYPELKIKLAAELKLFEEQRFKVHDNRELSSNDSTDDIIAKLLAINIDSLHESEMLIESRVVRQVIELLHQAERIEIYSDQAINFVAEDMQTKWLQLGKLTTYVPFGKNQLLQANHATKQTVAFVMSYYGDKQELIAVCQKLRENGAKVIVMTQMMYNPMSQLATYRLPVLVKETKYRNATMAAPLAMLTLIDILYHVYAHAYCE
ncbi:MAG: MurR/RpiR family transcriptional regulator [Culicoidibacterales bacterium]